MRLIIGILSTARVVSNLIINSIPLFVMTLLRVIVRLLGLKKAESHVARWADLVIDSWVVINRLTFRLLGLARVEVSWEGRYYDGNEVHMVRLMFATELVGILLAGALTGV